MKRIIYGMPLKVAMFIISLITVLMTFVAALGVFVLFEFSAYSSTRDETQQYLLRRMAISDAHSIGCCVVDGVPSGAIEINHSDKNITYTITNGSGELLLENYDGSSIRFTVTEEVSTDRYFAADGSVHEYVEVSVYVPTELKISDKYYYADKYMGKLWDMRLTVFGVAALCALASILCWIFFACVAGRSVPDGELKASVLDRVPFDIMSGAAVLIFFAGWRLLEEMYNYFDDAFEILILGVGCVGLNILALLWFITFCSRIKQKTLIKKTLIFAVLSFVWRGVKWAFTRILFILKNIPFIWKTVIITLSVSLIGFVLTLSVGCGYDEHLVIWLLGVVTVVPFILYVAIMLSKLKKGGETIAAGDLSAKIDTSFMFGDFRRFGESLNHINDGVKAAVDSSMRSERMKTELITNVSHDIKTPLTSIINYVDLIKKQEPESEEIKGYIEVLDRQSRRLKKLIEDLVEASKASSGAISVELVPCDVGVLLGQAVGEFDERLKEKNLELVMNLPQRAVRILADGRRLWRVFDNLLGNICKYSMNSSRVYIDLSAVDGRVSITFKNISGYPLNISGEELTERFVRGDRSRHTEGSGLGLSIAKSLVQLQKGNMDIIIDGDLFKVIIEFGELR